MCGERDMGSRDKDQTAPHQPLLSSLVIRATDTGGGAGSDYEPGEVRRDPPPYSRSDRHDSHGYRARAGSVSPVRRRDGHHRFSPGFDNSGGPPRGRGFGSGREAGRYRDYSPPYGRGKDRRFADRGFDRSMRGRGGPGPFRVDGLTRNNPNVQPREGDWVCSDPACKNLNFARREHCNNCNRPRYGPVGSPRRGFPGPAFPPHQRFPGPPLDRSPGRFMSGGGFRSPPRGWPRDAPRDFRPPPRHEGRFPGDRKNYLDVDNRERPQRFDNRAMEAELGHRERGRDNHFNEKRGYGRRALSPLPAPVAGGWAPHMRQRSRSPVRGGAPPQRDAYINRGRDDRRAREEL